MQALATYNSLMAANPNLQANYSAAEQAAVAALRGINAQSIRENVEFAGMICGNSDGTFFATGPNRGTADSSSAGRCSSGTTPAGDYHTHAAWAQSLLNPETGYDGNVEFSGADMDGNDAGGYPGWLATPFRALRRYDPVPGSPRGGTVTDLMDIYGWTP